jgi:hypothetical protein
MDQTSYQNQLAESLANWSKSEKDRQNQIKQNKFGNEATILGGKTGVQQANMAQDQSAAQGKSQAIQGVGSGITSGIQYWDTTSRQDDALEAEKERKKKMGGY